MERSSITTCCPCSAGAQLVELNRETVQDFVSALATTVGAIERAAHLHGAVPGPRLRGGRGPPSGPPGPAGAPSPPPSVRGPLLDPHRSRGVGRSPSPPG